MTLLAAGVSIMLGATAFQTQDENHWFQRRYPHQIERVSPSFDLGWQHGRWRLHYSYLGRAKSLAVADPDDGNYRPHTELGGPCRKACLPVHELPVWQGRGEVHGVGLTYRWQPRPALGIEAGVLAYRPTWEQTVVGWYPPDRPDERSTFTVRHSPRIGLTPQLALSYRLWPRAEAVMQWRPRLQQGGQYAPLFHRSAVTVGVRLNLGGR